MALSPGTHLGPYEIQSALGAGGMGEVYRARDTRLDRSVAVKILPAALAADAHFRERFDREARAISQLTHPHICTLYDVGEHDGTAFLVMELIQGETLAERLKKGGLPPEQALTVAIEIASALEAAHRHGIVHRDLKPGNVMLTKAGAKLLDFGLAKARGPALAGTAVSTLPTTPPNLTENGTILGTFQYIAPEQLEGLDADARTDLFACGAVLYEMLTGKKAFEGKSQASLIAAILDHDPPAISTTQPLASPALDHLVRVCLAKDPDERWQSASDLRRELKWIAETRSGGVLAPNAPRGGRSESIRWALVAFVIGSLATAVAFTALTRRFSSPPPEVLRSLIDIAPADQFPTPPTEHGQGHPARIAIVLSPDGRSIVFSAVRAGRQQLYVRPLDRMEAIPIAGTEDGAGPFFSPDGRWVGYWARGELRKVPLAGGPPTSLCKLGERPFGATWGSDGRVIVGRSSGGLWQVPAAGGNLEPFTKLDMSKGEVSHRLPHVLPDADGVIYTVSQQRFPKWADTQVVIHSRRTGVAKLVLEGGADARYVTSGHLVYARAGALMAAPFDLIRQEVTGPSVAVIPDVMQAAYFEGTGNDSGAAQFSVSQAGALIYVPGGVVPDLERSLVWVDRAGNTEPLPIPPRAFQQPRLSPDGQRFAVHTIQTTHDIWVFEVARHTLTRLTTEGQNASAVWTPDGTRIAYRSAITGPDNLFWRNSDGSGTPERLTTSVDYQVPASWSPDGRALAFYGLRQAADSLFIDISILPLEGDHQPKPLIRADFIASGIDFSPDGRWLAYASNQSGRNEVYVQPYPGPGSRRQISIDGGMAPVWRRDGQELLFVEPQTSVGSGAQDDMRMMAVPISTRPTLRIGTVKPLFQGSYVAVVYPARGYDVTPDGQRFLMLQEKPKLAPAVREMVLVQNWFEELKQRVPTR